MIGLDVPFPVILSGSQKVRRETAFSGVVVYCAYFRPVLFDWLLIRSRGRFRFLPEVSSLERLMVCHARTCA